ncbi:DUF4114 domain-containing protein [Segetibacter aerophilus]|uniref:DUF4114 domain-containing protein n=1 Tax=Segetibacter aerophilus TaxID=670293 RepID=A0A512BET8_9BACT|nr:DUF4114 domain-containing protein [Segetibacter aerophilus]GEO10480.1 hypothetical protein SAE01_29760 [Segetibacter aerophilus]
MKIILSAFTVLIIALSCKKPLTERVHFTSTSYQNLATFDNTGKPNNLEASDAISSNLLSFITTTLPENTNLATTNSDLLSSSAIGDIPILQRLDVSITFVSEGASKANAFAFYTYPTSSPPKGAKDIKTITYVFPNAGAGTTLQRGNKVKLGSFEPGISIGFVLIQGAWDANTKNLNNGAVHFCSNDVLNPEVDPRLKKHAVLINYPLENKVLIGFEDLDRTQGSDNDFNDLVIYATVTP